MQWRSPSPQPQPALMVYGPHAGGVVPVPVASAWASYAHTLIGVALQYGVTMT